MKTKQLKVEGPMRTLEDILRIIYDRHPNPYYSEKYYETCRCVLDRLVINFDYQEFINCDEYEIKMHKDGNTYLYLTTYDHESTE